MKTKTLILLTLVVILAVCQFGVSSAATEANVDTVTARGGTLTISGIVPCQQIAYSKISVTKKPENAIKVFVYRKSTGLKGCFQSSYRYYLSVNIQKYITPERTQNIYVNGVKYFP